MKPHVENAPGLVWKKKASGWEALWRARADVIDKGFAPKNVPLWKGEDPSPVDVERIQNQCQRLQGEMLAFGRGLVTKAPVFDGTLKTLIYCYQTDADSTYHGKRYAVRKHQDFALKRLVKSHGHHRIADIKARLLIAWHKEWCGEDGTKVTTAHAMMAHLRTLFTFGTTLLEDPECERVRSTLHLMKFPQGKPRTVHLTAEHVISVRKVANAKFRFSIALAQAFQFELTLRQKDVIGEYVPLSEPGISATVYPKINKKWIMGLRWEEIDENMILRHKTSKRGKDIEVNLRFAPMVIEELGTDDRSTLPASGPIILSETTGYPYSTEDFRKKWRKIANEAGVPKTIRNMDTRAGAISEAVISGAPLPFIRHAATHSDIAMTQKYDRQQAEATATVMQLRVGNRNKSKSE